MKKQYIILLYILLIALLPACSDDADIDEVAYEPRVVVEGYIENGKYPIVLLTVSASITGPTDTLSLLSHVIKSAKVSVSDGTNTEVLLLQTNNNKIPPYEYIGLEMKGEVGKTYELKVEYQNKVISSTTYIPQPIELDDIWFVRNSPTDTLGYIHVTFNNTSKEYYQIATQLLQSEKLYTPCLFGNINSKSYPRDEQVSMQINKGPILYPKKDFSTDFSINSTVRLRFSTQSEVSYKFWSTYQNEILNTQNPIFPANTSLASNINGGIGIWCGLGSYEYNVVLKDVER
ncbi:MAG: DUF4249 domain-containing protein [Prevotella sp.]|jgi:hypothetical protein|nr:DUF4249 domain-containing protein [Prevotella sp.]